jgi:uncharacterized protein (DUF1697 family)
MADLRALLESLGYDDVRTPPARLHRVASG